jgi:hypothetical protein
MSCGMAVQASEGRVVVIVPGAPPRLLHESAGEVTIGIPCSCACRTTPLPALAVGLPAGPIRRSSTEGTLALSPVPAPASPSPPQDHDILALGLFLVFGATAALSALCGPVPRVGQRGMIQLQGQAPSALISATELEVRRAIDRVSMRHLWSVARFLLRRRP